MSNTIVNWIMTKFSQWLLKEDPAQYKDFYCDFDKMCQDIKVGDVILMQGRNRISNIIRHITFSLWTHSALYIGRLNDIEDPLLRDVARKYCQDDPNKQLVIESDLGIGTIILDIAVYREYPVRILRPQQLSDEDSRKVASFAINRVGRQYDVRHILDLARFLFPWGILPKRWRSSLFEHNALQPTKDICSSMIADAFQSVEFPILPLIEKGYEKEIAFIRRNNRLYTPSDFDYSPYFDVMKYPLFPIATKGGYHHLPWKINAVSDDEGLNYIPLTPKIMQFFTSPAYAVVGASADRKKFGNKVLRCYLQNNKKVYPVNPHESVIEGLRCISEVANLPPTVKSISIVTPPHITENIVDQAIKKGIQNIWMQPGAESVLAIQKCKDHKVNVIADGSCVLKELRFQDESTT